MIRGVAKRAEFQSNTTATRARQETSMRKYFSVVAIALTMVLTSYAIAKDKAAKPMHGKVEAVDTTAKTIKLSVHGKKGEAPTETTVTYTDTTKFSKEGGPGTIADVTADVSIAVTLVDATATPAVAATIEVLPPHKEKGVRSNEIMQKLHAARRFNRRAVLLDARVARQLARVCW